MRNQINDRILPQRGKKKNASQKVHGDKNDLRHKRFWLVNVPTSLKFWAKLRKYHLFLNFVTNLLAT